MKKLLFLLPLALLACAPKEAETPTPKEEPLRVQVRVVEARRGVLERAAQVAVTLQAERDSLVAAGASGRVQRTLPAGSRVAQGEGVVFLDPAPFQEALAQARLALAQAEATLERTKNQISGNRPALLAQLEAAKAQLEAARRRYEEGKALLAVGALAPLDLKALEAQYQQAQSAYENAKEALDRLDRAEDLRLLELQVEAARLQVRQAERNLKEATIRAPFAGEVVEVYVKEGEFVGVGNRAFRLATTDRLLAKAYLPPEEAARLTPETRFLLRQSGQEVPARLLRKTDLPGQNRLVEVVLKPEAPLTPGPAEARYQEKVAEGILLPALAVRAEEGQAVVYAVEGDRARRLPVRLLAQEGDKAAVEGLKEGTLVVYPVPEGLREGDLLEVVR
jgi:HlyD family secretion protein